MSTHSLYIFERLYNDLPPLVPEEIKKEMENNLIEWKNNSEVLPNEVEDAMIKYGKKTWPHRRAFQEVIQKYKAKLGEIFLRRKISKQIEKKYEQFLAQGGNFETLYVGGPQGFFLPNERVELSQALVGTLQDIKEQSRQAVLSVERDWYERRIVELLEELVLMEEKIFKLRQSAGNWDNHPDLANEVLGQIKAFEEGLSILGPQTHWSEIDNVEDFYSERHREKEAFRTLI